VPSTQTPRSRTGPGTFLDFADPNIDTEEDEADMGEPGSAFTRGDWCIIARFIAKNHWDEMASKERWDTFTDTVRGFFCVTCNQLKSAQYETRRSGKSWAEFYRRNETGKTSLVLNAVLLAD
jgi:hypothetical protein